MSMSELEVLAHIDREMLYSFVWGIPAEILAERMRVSVVSIERSCANRGIPFPDEGYWMKVAAGVKPVIPSLTKHRPGPRGTTGTVEDAIDGGKTKEKDPLKAIDDLLGAGTVDLIVSTAKAIVIDPDAELRPQLSWQRDVCSSERALQKWLSENELSCRHLWYYASPGSVARMCAILEAMGRAAESLGGSYDEGGFDIFGERVHVGFSEHLGKYRKGQTPSRAYNGLLTMYVGTDVYKDFRKKTLERDVPRAFVNLCVNAAYQAKDRRDALADAHDRAESLRRYARALEDAGRSDEAAWVLAKADWADPVTHSHDEVFGDAHTSDGSAPARKPQIPYESKGVEADGYFGQPIGDPSPTLETFRKIHREHRDLEG